MDKGFRSCCSVVFDFFDSEVGVCGDATESGIVGCGVYVDDDEDWVGDVTS